MSGPSWYANLLLDPRWQKRRLEIMARDGWKCLACGSHYKTLTVHHVGYIAGMKPWEYDDAMLETLCVDCHNSRHVWPLPKPESCHRCGLIVTNDNLGGRDGKHELICEACIQSAAQSDFSILQ